MNDHVDPIIAQVLNSINQSSPVKVSKLSGLSFTQYKITGQLRDVFDEIARLFRDYPPQGYGTCVRTLQYVGPDYETIVHRANSCD